MSLIHNMFGKSALHHLFVEQIRHAVREAIDWPTSAASSARNRYPNSGSSRCASNKALARYACSSSALVKGSAQDFVFLFEKLDPFAGLDEFGVLGRGGAGFGAVLDVVSLEPTGQARLADPEVGGDLFQLLAGFSVAGHAHDVVAELFGVGLGHDIHPSSSVCRHHRSDATSSCSSPVPWGLCVPCRRTDSSRPPSSQFSHDPPERDDVNFPGRLTGSAASKRPGERVA